MVIFRHAFVLVCSPSLVERHNECLIVVTAHNEVKGKKEFSNLKLANVRTLAPDDVNVDS